MTARPAYFSAGTFHFLRSLAQNNDREWFAAHKADYEDYVKAPFLNLIADLAEPLGKISPQIIANPRPMGGSMFRIYRDTRFSGDKRPYKEHAGATFYHAATRDLARGGDADHGTMGRLDGPVFYLHLSPHESFCGGGLWHPQPVTLKRTRDYMLNNPASWKAACYSSAFRKIYGQLGGESLRRPPRGYDPSHELVEDLKRKDYVCAVALDEATLCGTDLLPILIKNFKIAAPLVDWLCGALDLEF
jgi:uncharacterized protein (TIGR02453 family)